MPRCSGVTTRTTRSRGPWQPAGPGEDMRERPAVDISKLLARLADPDQPLSRRSLAGLSDLEPAQVRTFLAEWRTLSRARRSELIQTLQTLAEDNVDLNFRPIFLGCLTDPEPRIRAISVDGLWEDESLGVLRQMLELLPDPAAEVRSAVLLNLSRFAYRAELGELAPADAQTIEEALLGVARDPRQPLDVQRYAVEALGYFPRSAAACAIIERAYAHESQRMRESAIVAMGNAMRPDWLVHIERELRSRSPALRYVAARAVGEFAEEGQAALPALLPLVEDDDSEVATAAIWALGQVGGPDARRIIQRLLRSPTAAIQQAASAALSELQADEL